jgi:dephospho-CoA kinase
VHLIGLTGGIASGKSLVSGLLSAWGAVVIDDDLVARQVVEPGQPGWKLLYEQFGPEFFTSEGLLDRKKLGALVFSHPAQRDKLERLLHPLIIEATRRMIAAVRQERPESVVVLDVPLLFEAGMESLVDQVWVVTVSRQTQLDRLMQRDKLTRQEAEERIDAQMPLSEKVRRAFRVIDNSGTAEETAGQLRLLWYELQR